MVSTLVMMHDYHMYSGLKKRIMMMNLMEVPIQVLNEKMQIITHTQAPGFQIGKYINFYMNKLYIFWYCSNIFTDIQM